MSNRPGAFSSKSLRFGLVIAVLAGVATGTVFWLQLRSEQRESLDDLDRRAQLLGHRVSATAVKALQAAPGEVANIIGDRLNGHSLLLGMVVFRADGSLIASGDGLSELIEPARGTLGQTLSVSQEHSTMLRNRHGSTHVLTQPVRDESGQIIGGVAVLHDALYLDERTTRGTLRGLLWSLGVTAGMFLISTGLVWTLFERPLHKLADWMRRLRFANTPELPPRNLPVGKLADETVHLAASFRAARSKERAEAQEIVRSDKAWTRDRLRAHAIDALSGLPLVVVSNREP